jgi:outer membrane immunogenic protein
MIARLANSPSHLAITALLAGSMTIGVAAAHAADLTIPPPTIAAAAFNWSGFYIGAHGGAASAVNHFNDPTYFISGSPFDVDSDGVLAGAQMGANWQIGHFVLGGEADISWASLTGGYSLSPILAASTVTTKIDALATGAARVGYAMGPWLLYGKGGLAWSDVQYVDSVIAGNLITVDDHRTGWTVGAGLELGVLHNLSAKVEYDFLYFGSESVPFGSSTIVARPINIDQQIQVIKAGINLHFNQ